MSDGWTPASRLDDADRALAGSLLHFAPRLAGPPANTVLRQAGTLDGHAGFRRPSSASPQEREQLGPYLDGIRRGRAPRRDEAATEPGGS